MKAIAFSVLSLILALLISGILILFIGENPLHIYRILFTASVGSMESLSYTIYYATPLVFTGLAVAVSFHVGLFNIGCEGQLYMGTLVATLVGLIIPEATSTSPFWILVIILASMIGGALWAAIPGILKVYRGSHEVITTIMMNFIALGLTSYVILYRVKDPTTQMISTPVVSRATYLPRLSSFLPFPENSPANFSFFISLIAALFVYIFLWKTKYGFAFRAVGQNERTSQCSGISSKSVMISALMISGALAGMVGLNDVFGNAYRMKDGFSQGYGFLGIAVALLGRNHPIGIVLAALLFGGLHNAGLALEFDTQNMSRDLVDVIQGLIIFFIAANTFFEIMYLRYMKKRVTA